MVARLADLDNNAVAATYLAPYAGLGQAGVGALSNDASAAVGGSGATPTEASGLDLPVGGSSDIGALGGGGSGGFIVLPPGHGGGSGGGGSGPSGGGGGGGGGTGTGPGGGPVIVPPITGGVPEPTTWALMLIGVGAIGALHRRDRRVAISA
jgi:hypothetical protein